MPACCLKCGIQVVFTFKASQSLQVYSEGEFEVISGRGAIVRSGESLRSEALLQGPGCRGDDVRKFGA